LNIHSFPETQARQREREPVVWFEVEDFLRYFDHFANPTGLQRVPFEIYVEAQRLYGATGRIGFCRLSVYTKQLRTVGFDELVSAYLNPRGARAPWRSLWAPAQVFEEFHRMLPLVIRHPRFFLSLAKAAARDFLGMRSKRNRFDQAAKPGDIIVTLGASWGVPGYMQYIADAKRKYGLKFAVLIHDLIPIEYESFVEERHAVQFRGWLQQAIAVADMVVTVSHHSRQALTKIAGLSGWSLPQVEVVPPGFGLNARLTADAGRKTNFPERFVLLVSTIEARKNHRLLVRVWRRLMERHGSDAIPTLIFAGQIGWLVDDLLDELSASNYLDGKIVLMPNLSDAELRQAYSSCLFAVFPSLCEGWGLPVAESLQHGKFCVASNRTSIPEVGGDLVDYFDPVDDDDALAKIERLLLDPDYLTAREARVRAEYRPRSWAECVHALIGTLNEAALDETPAFAGLSEG
jgi:glycosyltransferase involved in cell wall biosynthesis